MEITITRALTVLKSKEQQLNLLVSSPSYLVGNTQKESKWVLFDNRTKIEKSEHKANAQGYLDKVNSLFDQIAELKSKIQKANQSTFVKIGQKTMSVAEVIIYKASVLNNKKALIGALKGQLNQANRQYQSNLEAWNKSVQEQITSYTSGDSKDQSAEKFAEKIESIKKLNETREPELSDPYDLGKLIENLSSEIIEFETEVDFCLSESNSTTKIEVEI